MTSPSPRGPGRPVGPAPFVTIGITVAREIGDAIKADRRLRLIAARTVEKAVREDRLKAARPRTIIKLRKETR